jgi:hypothetical protein
VYLMQSRLRKNAYLTLFDGADPSVSTGVRPSTTTPLQALFSMNDPLLHQCAEGLATRHQGSIPDNTARIHALYLRALCRKPSADEEQRALTFLSQYRAALAEHPSAATEKTPAETRVWTAFARALLATNEFVYLD